MFLIKLGLLVLTALLTSAEQQAQEALLGIGYEVMEPVVFVQHDAEIDPEIQKMIMDALESSAKENYLELMNETRLIDIVAKTMSSEPFQSSENLDPEIFGLLLKLSQTQTPVPRLPSP